LLESTYRFCLAKQLESEGIAVRQEVPISISYKGFVLPTAYRADLVVEDATLVELKAVETILPVHEAQILTYMRHGSFSIGLLLNFNVKVLKHGIRRFVR